MHRDGQRTDGIKNHVPFAKFNLDLNQACFEERMSERVSPDLRHRSRHFPAHAAYASINKTVRHLLRTLLPVWVCIAPAPRETAEVVQYM